MEFVPFALLYRPVTTVIHVFIELNVKRSRRPLYARNASFGVWLCVGDRNEVECVCVDSSASIKYNVCILL